MSFAYFPKSYEASRETFLQMAKRLPLPAEVRRWPISSRTETDLSVDYVYLPPLKEARKLLVITSGIHGSETYAGAAVQFQFMQEILPRLKRDHIGVWIVH